MFGATLLFKMFVCPSVCVSHFLKNIEKIDLQNPNSFPLPSLFDFQEELKFGQDLFINTLENFDELKLNIEGKTPNWESDRIAQIDYVILITAIAELIYFSSIPTKVTINEYIDIAKEFSTPASGKFVNGFSFLSYFTSK